MVPSSLVIVASPAPVLELPIVPVEVVFLDMLLEELLCVASSELPKPVGGLVSNVDGIDLSFEDRWGTELSSLSKCRKFAPDTIPI